MIYLIGGAPRCGKTILCRQAAAKMGAGWTSTDLLVDLLRLAEVDGVKTGWDASPGAVAAASEWFYPYLERYAWGVRSLAEDYLIEGVDFLPAQVVPLAARHPVKAVFLGCARMTPERFDQYAGNYARLPEGVRRQMAAGIAAWSQFIQQEAERFGYAYVDTGEDFFERLKLAEEILAA